MRASTGAAQRGGYCFEHGTLFAAALEALGFAPQRHTARVVLVAARSESPRTHMFLTVALPEGRFVVDPGFGSLAPRVPLPLEDGRKVAFGTDVHWMVRDGGLWVLRMKGEDKVVDCWVSEVGHDNRVDFEVGNHYTATHPASPFVNRMMLRALTTDGRVSVMNRDVTIRRGTQLQTWQLADRAELRALLAETFGFDLPEVESMHVPAVEGWN